MDETRFVDDSRGDFALVDTEALTVEIRDEGVRGIWIRVVST